MQYACLHKSESLSRSAVSKVQLFVSQKVQHVGLYLARPPECYCTDWVQSWRPSCPFSEISALFLTAFTEEEELHY